jgi:hypothetical protein
VSSPIATLSPSLVVALWFSWIYRSRLRCQVFSPSAAKILISGEANSVSISFSFTNPSPNCSYCPIVVQDELGLRRILEVDSLTLFT